MSEMNPNPPPGSQTAPVTDGFIPGSRVVDAGRGWEWIVSGFALFKKQPGMWILFFVVYAVFSILLGFVPLLGGLVNMLLYPVFAAGMMLGCRALDTGGELEIEHFFAGFKRNTSNLMILGLLMLVALIVILVPAMLLVGGAGFFAGTHGGVAGYTALGMTMVLTMLVVLAASVPVYMALWFAPALVVFRDMKPMEALKTSFLACLKNIVPFLLYGVIALALCVIAAIPFALGFVVLVPVLIASIYAAYRDIFFAGHGVGVVPAPG